MRSKKILAAAAAFSLLASGTAAAQSAQSLSVAGSPAVQRAGAPMEDRSDLGGRRRGILGWILGAGAIALLIFVITETSKDNDLPASA